MNSAGGSLMDRDKLLRICVFFYALLNVIYYFFPWEPLFYLALANLFYVLAAAVFNQPAGGFRAFCHRRSLDALRWGNSPAMAQRAE